MFPRMQFKRAWIPLSVYRGLLVMTLGAKGRGPLKAFMLKFLHQHGAGGSIGGATRDRNRGGLRAGMVEVSGSEHQRNGSLKLGVSMLFNLCWTQAGRLLTGCRWVLTACQALAEL